MLPLPLDTLQIFSLRTSKIFGFIGLPLGGKRGFGQNIEPQELRGKILRDQELAVG